MKGQEARQTNRDGLRQAGYEQHPKETSSVTNKTGGAFRSTVRERAQGTVWPTRNLSGVNQS